MSQSHGDFIQKSETRAKVKSSQLPSTATRHTAGKLVIIGEKVDQAAHDIVSSEQVGNFSFTPLFYVFSVEQPGMFE